MDMELLHALTACETDVTGALRRFCGDETLYASCVAAFLEDRTMHALECAVASGDWDDAFTAAHALKGLAGNLGFVPLFHESAELVVLIRTGRIGETAGSLRKVQRCYQELLSAIRPTGIQNEEEPV